MNQRAYEKGPRRDGSAAVPIFLMQVMLKLRATKKENYLDRQLLIFSIHLTSKTSNSDRKKPSQLG